MEQGLKRLTLQELECFLRVARIGSIREVARILSMETAQLSRMIKRLEERLAVRLFDRSARGLSLTPLGREVFVSAERIWMELEHISSVRVAKKAKSATAFTIDGIGAAPYLTQFVIAPAFATLQESGLLQKARVAELPVERLVLSGLSGHIDVAVHTGELGFPKTWLTEKIGVIAWRLYGSSKRFSGAKLSKGDLEKLSFVYPVFWSQEGLRDGDRDFPHAPVVRDKCIGVTSAFAAVELIRTTGLVSYLPEIVVERLGADDVRRLHIEDEVVMKDDLWMSFRADALTKRTVTSLLKAMRNVLGRTTD